MLPAIVDLQTDAIEQRGDLAGRCRPVVDSTAEPKKLDVLTSKLSGAGEGRLPVDGPSRVPEFGLHVDAEEAIERRGRDLVGPCDNDRLARDVLVVEGDSGQKEGIEGQRGLTS